MRFKVAAAFLTVGMTVIGCTNTDSRVGDRPPPAASVKPMEGTPGINHEGAGTNGLTGPSTSTLNR